MRSCPHPAEVRQLVMQAFRELGAPVANPLDLDETIRLDRGRYVARSYRTGGLMAMWLVDVGILQFYNADGAMLLTINLLSEQAPQRAVA